MSPAHSFSNNIPIIMSEILFYQLVMCAIATAINLYALQSNGIFTVHAITSTYDLASVLTATFIYCYLSEMLTCDLSGICEIFYNSAWYQLPAKQQKLVFYTIQHSQRSFRLRGIGIIECSLGTFFMVGLDNNCYFCSIYLIFL